jgi:trehalose-6-phosphate synthase
MASINTMVKQCMGLIDTRDVTDWENNFLKSIKQRTDEGNNTSSLTENQITVLERLYNKHFAG